MKINENSPSQEMYVNLNQRLKSNWNMYVILQIPQQTEKEVRGKLQYIFQLLFCGNYIANLFKPSQSKK